MELFTSPYGYPDSDLAAIYGVTAPAKEFERVAFPAGSERAGLLGQGLFLAVTAKPEDSARRPAVCSCGSSSSASTSPIRPRA